jgi:hypothetical protein
MLRGMTLPMHPYDLTPREAFAAYRDDALSENDLLRAITGHAAWRVMAETTPDGRDALGVIVQERGGRLLELFSDAEAVATFVATQGDGVEPVLREVDGPTLFSRLPDDIAHRINLDLGSTHAFRYKGEQIPLLRAWAEVATVELALLAPDRFANPFAVLRRGESYRILIRKLGDERDWVMAPDAHDRTLAAVFTADDTIDAFIAQVESELEGTLEIVTQSGTDLFRAVDALDVDGIVFNPLSHLRPVALSAAVASKVLETARQ